MRPHLGLWFVCVFVLGDRLSAQQAGEPKLTIEAATEQALSHYPALRAVGAQADAAGAGIGLAKTAYLPKLDLLWQENRATRNNVFGLLLPQSTIPAISGPVLEDPSWASAWGSAGGMLLSWEPFDFGLRKSNINLARSLKTRADANTDLTRLDVAAAAADSFLLLLSADQRALAAQANVERMEVLSASVHALVDNHLRAGVDASRVDAEMAAARNLLILTQQEVEIARANLAEAIGMAGATVEVDPGPCLRLMEDPPPPVFKLESHPMAQAQAAGVESERARRQVLDHSFYPRINYQFALFARGSGAIPDGRIDSGKGLWPDVANWATGLTVTLPVFDIFAIRARRRAQISNEIVEQARQEQIMQALRTQESKAQAVVAAARRIAENTPVQVKAAREMLASARVRYETGLAPLTEPADAQRLLVQAEMEDAVARINVWRAVLARSRSEGSMKPFLERVRAENSRRSP